MAIRGPKLTRACLPLLLYCMSGCGGQRADHEIVNVSYDPTRELYKEINAAFAADFESKTGKTVHVTQSHGGSGAQARAVIDGLPADVVTLGLGSDIDAIARKELLAADWQSRFENNSCPHISTSNSCPYTSTIIFVVRKGNPKNIRDWPDLIRSDVSVITPNPKTSGGARWNFLAAWGYEQRKNGDAAAVEFVRRLYANVKKLDTGARGSAETFIRRKQGDVFLSWENEAVWLRRELPKAGLELVYPSETIEAEPPVALVDKNVDERGTRAVAQAYLDFLYSDGGQDIIGKHGYRPRKQTYLDKYAEDLPPVSTFTLADLKLTWAEAQSRFFGDGGVFDQVYLVR